MRKNKFIKLIEHILVALPLLMVLVTCCYTIWNSNANQSYYGDTINESEDIQVDYSDLVINENYIFDNPVNDNKTNEYGSTTKIYVENLIKISGFSDDLDLSSCSYINLYLNNTYNAIQFYDSNNIQLYTFNMYAKSVRFSFTYKGYTGIQSSISYYNYFYYVAYNQYSYLSNAFEYSLSQFINMGFGKINFTGFFVDMFHNGQTNVYIDFANSYLNYMLFIECTFVLPLVLYWFIHIGENILYKFEKGEW